MSRLAAPRLDPSAARLRRAAQPAATRRAPAPTVVPAFGFIPSLTLSPNGRSALTLAFGVLLGFALANLMSFYDRAPVQERLPSAEAGRSAEPRRFPSAETPVAPASSSPTPLLTLLGGQEPPGRESLFCAIWVAKPDGCAFEAQLRLAAPALAIPQPPAAMAVAAAPTPTAAAAPDKRRIVRRAAAPRPDRAALLPATEIPDSVFAPQGGDKPERGVANASPSPGRER